MRTRIKSRKVSSSPAWLKKYQPAHTATADELGLYGGDASDMTVQAHDKKEK